MLPPSCNTGVATPPDAVPLPTTPDVFLDYLACHVDADTGWLVEQLCSALRLEARLGRPMHGYTHCAELEHGADVWARVYYSHDTKPFLQVSGEPSQVFENTLRTLRVRYRVTRKDAALDLYDGEWFGILVGITKDFALSAMPPRKVEYAGDWLHAKKGRTLYCGARTSRVFLRLYEKGRKEGTDPDWVRAEVEYKPQSEAEQYHAAELTAGQVWALRAYHVWGRILGVSQDTFMQLPPRTRPRVRRDVQRSRHALCSQYGKVLEQWLIDCDGDAGALLSEVIEGIQAARAARELVSQVGAAIDSPELTP